MVTSDSFEKTAIMNIWKEKKSKDSSIQVQEKVVRRGKKAVRFKIEKGDSLNSGESHQRLEEFDELVERKDLGPVEGEDYCYSFSIYLPKNFPIYEEKTILAKWKQNEFYGIHNLNKAVLSLRYKAGELSILLETNGQKKVLFSTQQEIRGKWLDFVFHLRFSRAEEGFVRVWLNKRQIVDFKGVTAHLERHSEPCRFYFVIGLHRNKMDKTITAYYDEYSKHRLYSKELREPRRLFRRK